MLYLVYGFALGFIIPFVSRRLGKILPATFGSIFFHLPHRPRFPRVHNPLQHNTFRKKWQTLLLYSIFVGITTSFLFFIAHTYLPGYIFPYAAAFISFIVASADVDSRYCILPDCLTIPLLLLGFLFSVQTKLLSPLQSVNGALFALIVVTSAVFALSFFKKTLFGGGDSKMLIALGAWLGIQGINYTIFTSFFLFVLYGFFMKNKSGPYGPALGLAGLFTFFVLYIK